MHVNKKIGRFKQWAGERMGGEVKTNLSDDFKAMETEMGVRHEGGCLRLILRDLSAKPPDSTRRRPYAQVHDHLCQSHLQAQ